MPVAAIGSSPTEDGQKGNKQVSGVIQIQTMAKLRI